MFKIMKIKSHINTTPVQGPNRAFREFVRNNGSLKIKNLRIGRRSLGNQEMFNVLSLGELNKKKKELEYKDLYHSFLIVTLSNDETYRIEKNHVVEATKASPQDGEYDIPLNGKDITLSELLRKGQGDNPDFYNYDLSESNCQMFAFDIIKNNNLYPEENIQIQEVIKPQEVKELLSVFPSGTDKVVKTITDLARLGDSIKNGGNIN